MEKISFDLLLKSALDLFYGAIDALEADEYENTLINELCILVWDFRHRKIKGKEVSSKLDTIAENYKGKLQHIDINIRLVFEAISNLYNMLKNDNMVKLTAIQALEQLVARIPKEKSLDSEYNKETLNLANIVMEKLTSKSLYCEKCGRKIKDEYSYCPHCGQKKTKLE